MTTDDTDPEPDVLTVYRWTSGALGLAGGEPYVLRDEWGAAAPAGHGLWQWCYQAAEAHAKLANGQGYTNQGDALDAALRVCGVGERAIATNVLAAARAFAAGCAFTSFIYRTDGSNLRVVIRR